jgi:hypothetical protein
MTIVNTEGLTLFGSGSEWFWVMLQFVVVAITLVGIWFQLRLARSANAFAQANAIRRDWDEERLTRRRLAIYIALHDGGVDADLSSLAPPIGNFWESVASLVRAGHIDLKVVYEDMGNACELWWNLLEPDTRRVQAQLGPDIFEHFEWLAGECRRLGRAQGIADDAYSRERILPILPERIAQLRATLDEFVALRMVVVAPAQDLTTPVALQEALPDSSN